MWICLTRKLADELDGVDVSRCAEGDMLEVPHHDAEVLIAEGWARPTRDSERNSAVRSASAKRAFTPDRSEGRVRVIDDVVPLEHRRGEDRIREELRDARARRVFAR